MEQLAPAGAVYQAGTLSGNPLAMAAGLSVLRRLREPGVYHGLERRAARLEAGFAPFGTVQRVGSMLTLFAAGPVESFADAQRATPSGTARSSGTCSPGRLRRSVAVRGDVRLARPRGCRDRHDDGSGWAFFFS